MSRNVCASAVQVTYICVVHVVSIFSFPPCKNNLNVDMLIRSCAGPRAGDGCVVCHSPAWVKDIQINRQLSSITEHFTHLESLLNPTEQPGKLELSYWEVMRKWSHSSNSKFPFYQVGWKITQLVFLSNLWLTYWIIALISHLLSIF